jgi:hypothetical protein
MEKVITPKLGKGALRFLCTALHCTATQLALSIDIICKSCFRLNNCNVRRSMKNNVLVSPFSKKFDLKILSLQKI